MLLAALLLSVPAQAQSPGGPDTSPPPPDYGANTFDVLVLRPLGFVGVVIGAALFVPVAVITAPGGRDTLEEALEMFVLVPGKFVFTRPLGSF